MIQKKEIDSGTGFDWGRISGDYAKYRDIYPEEFYQRLLDRGVCTLGQDVLDIGTGYWGNSQKFIFPWGKIYRH